MQKVSDILKNKSKQTWTITPDATVFEALKLMADKEIGKIAGIMTERDYARKIVLKGKASPKTLVKEIMTPFNKMFTVKPDTSVEDCMVLMTGKHIRHVPVFDGAKFMGLVSIGDAVKSTISEKDVLINQLSNYIAGQY